MDRTANIVLEKHMATKEQIIRLKKKEQEKWFEENYEEMLKYALDRGSSEETLQQSIREVWEEDIREIMTGKRSKK